MIVLDRIKFAKLVEASESLFGIYEIVGALSGTGLNGDSVYKVDYLNDVTRWLTVYAPKDDDFWDVNYYKYRVLVTSYLTTEEKVKILLGEAEDPFRDVEVDGKGDVDCILKTSKLFREMLEQRQ